MMKKQLLDLTIEEFTCVLLDYQPQLTFVINNYEKENDEIKGTYKTLCEFASEFKPDNPFRCSMTKELDSLFDYEIDISELDIYNYLDHTTKGFKDELISIVLREMEHSWREYEDDFSTEAYNTYAMNGWEMPKREYSYKRKDGTIMKSMITEIAKMKERIYPCREFQYFTAINLLKRKWSNSQPMETQSEYKIADKHKTNFVKTLSAMYDCGLFETIDGKKAKSKKKFFKTLCGSLNFELEDYSPLLSSGKNKKTFLDFFDEIKKKGEEYYNNGK